MNPVDDVMADVKRVIDSVCDMNHQELRHLLTRAHSEITNFRYNETHTERIEHLMNEVSKMISAGDTPLVQNWKHQAEESGIVQHPIVRNILKRIRGEA